MLGLLHKINRKS